MEVYTGYGDKGMTDLSHTKNVSKSDDRICLMGSVEELMSHIGLVRVLRMGKIRHPLITISGINLHTSSTSQQHLINKPIHIRPILQSSTINRHNIQPETTAAYRQKSIPFRPPQSSTLKKARGVCRGAAALRPLCGFLFAQKNSSYIAKM